MRTLSGTLTKAQKGQAGEQLAKVVLVKGATRYAYTIDDLLLDCAYTEEGITQKADLIFENAGGTFTSLDLRGYTANVSFGYRTGLARSAWVVGTAYAVDDIVRPTTANGYQYRCSVAGTSHAVTEPTWSTTLGAVQTDNTVTWEVDGRAGDEYSRRAPTLIIAPDILSYKDSLKMAYASAGKGNQLGEDRASADYFPLSTNTDTVKTIINAILGATMSCFSHCSVVTVTYDTEDALIDSFAPADSFKVYYHETRKDKVEELLSWTKCVGRFEKDGNFHIRKLVNGKAPTWAANTAYLVGDTVKPTTDNGHVYKCTTAGTSHATTEPTWTTTEGGTNSDGTVTWTLTYDYSYNDLDSAGGTNHLFWSDSHRNAIVVPNKIKVESHPDHAAQYNATATDSENNALYDARDFKRLRLANSAQALNIANALLTNYQRKAERGSAFIPMNVGQEMYDLVRLTDTRSGAKQIGNVGYLYAHVAVKPSSLSKSGKLIAGRGNFDMSLRLGSPSAGVPMGITAPASFERRTSPTTQDIDTLYANQQILQDYLSSLQDQIKTLSTIVAGISVSVNIVRSIGVIAVDATTDVTVADGKAYIPIPAVLHNMNLFRAQAIVITAGTTNATTIDIYNVTDSVDMLSTAISIASGATVGTVGTINTSYDDVAVNDVLRVDVTTASTTKPKGLLVILEFAYP